MANKKPSPYIRALGEAAKELARVATLAIIPLLIEYLSSGKEINWGIIGVTAAIAALRALDQYLHEYGKDTNNERLKKGLLF